MKITAAIAVFIAAALVVANAFTNPTSAPPIIDATPIINMRMINEINSMGTTWTAGVNERMKNLTVKDFQKLLGVIYPFPMPPVKELVVSEALPTQFDARVQWPKCIGPVLDQGHCGSCWAFGAVESLQDRICIQTQKVFDLGEQDLVSCDKGSSGCNGGFPLDAWNYMKENGVVTESCYPYQMGTCHHPGCSEWPTPACNMTCKNGATFATDKHFAATAYSISNNADQIAQEIYTHGPVEVTMAVYADFANYASGVYAHKTGDLLGYHAIKAIGWGVQDNVNYWIVQNSWNPTWGAKGYFLIQRGTNECGIESGVVAGLAKV